MSAKAAAAAESEPILQQQPPAGPSYDHRLYDYDPFSPELLAYADARARTRVAKAILCGIAVYIFAGCMTGYGIFRGVHDRWKKGRWQMPGQSWPETPDPLPRDGRALSCGIFSAAPAESNWPLIAKSRSAAGNSTRAFFDIDLGQGDGLFVSAQGSLARGSIDFRVESPLRMDRDEESMHDSSVQVEVSVDYNDARLLSLANVCTMQRDGARGQTERGIGLYTPESDLPAASSHIAFNITVRIPPNLRHLASLDVRAAELEMTGTLRQLSVPRVQLDSQNARIAVSHINGDRIRLSATNGLISGFYNVSESLSLKTSNGRIEADVALHPKTREPISVEATSSNGAVHLAYVHHQLGVELHSKAQTTNGAAYVTMRPAFEGTFDVQTTYGASFQHGPAQMSHPDGGQRQLTITKAEHSLGHSRLAGNVFWEHQRAEHPGRSRVATTNGAATLTFE